MKIKDDIKILEESWKNYRIMAMLSKSGAPVHEKDAKQAFYAGASVLFHILMNFDDTQNIEPTENDLSMMDRIYRELCEFGMEFDASIFRGKTHA